MTPQLDRPSRRAAGERLSDRRWPVTAVLLLSIPLIVWTIWWIRLGWLPQGDEGVIALKTHDVFSSHPPLLGMRSTSAISVPGVWAHHPGPMEFYLLAIPYAVSGWHPFGLLLGCLILAVLVVALTIWQSWIVGGARGVWLAAGAILGAELLLGRSVVLPWNPWPPVLASAALMALSWRVLRGRLSALPWFAAVASYVLQSNLALLPIVSPLLLLLTGVGLVRWRTERGTVWPMPGWGGPARHTPWWRRPGVIATAVTLLCWAPPIAEIALISPNNPSQVWQLVTHSLSSPLALGGVAALLVVIGWASWTLGRAAKITNRTALLGFGYGALPRRTPRIVVATVLGVAALGMALLLGPGRADLFRKSDHDIQTSRNARVVVWKSLTDLRTHHMSGGPVVIRTEGLLSYASYQTAVAAALATHGYQPYFDSGWPKPEDDSFRRVDRAPRSAPVLKITDASPATVTVEQRG
ncbi:hypothetical protein HJ588_04800 [Flexivirga sp. ID2601S]|uniref:Glycosyltransferase RgtA/B/C/D-like domain-containing protein n=1 Tax=Flexivirga aerilata TaxID=1656889 RepID=A0A849AGA3_9MICO|nr:hypothetical protein [Flexivirga aerilata]NNG38596.1 hypothetical protein [Flexivirga aerilata]